MKSGLIRTTLIVLPLLMAACGGGGGGGGAASAPATPLVITSDNAPVVASETVDVATNTDAADTAANLANASSGLVTGVELSSSGVGNPMRLADAARQLVIKAQGSGTLAAGVTVSEPCSAGGSVTVDVNVSVRGTLNAGDRVQITANNCAERSGAITIVMNGRMSISIQSGSYNPSSGVYPKNVTMRIDATNFTVNGAGESAGFSGDLTMKLTENSATTGSVLLTANSLSSTVGSHTVTLSNYTLSVDEGASSSTASITANVETNNSRLGSGRKSYSIATVTPMTQSSAGVMTAGSIKMTGKDSALLLTVSGPDTFTLQLDTNGDGSYDSTSSVTRSQLKALI